MKKQSGILNLLLAAVVGVVMVVYMVCRTIQPAVVLPVLNIPMLLTLSTLALILKACIAPQTEYCWILAAVLAAVTFALLPWAAGEADAREALMLGLWGGVAFAIAERIFASLGERVASGRGGKLAMAATGICLILAGQCFAGILL